MRAQADCGKNFELEAVLQICLIYLLDLQEEKKLRDKEASTAQENIVGTSDCLHVSYSQRLSGVCVCVYESNKAGAHSQRHIDQTTTLHRLTRPTPSQLFLCFHRSCCGKWSNGVKP